MVVSTSVRTKSTKIYLEPGDATTCLVGEGGVTMGTFVMLTTGGLGNHPKVIAATAGKPIYGVAHFTAAAGEEVSVLREGTVGVTAGTGGVTSGNEISVGTGGKAVPASAGSQLGSGDYAITAPTLRVGVATADAAEDAMAPVTLYTRFA